MTSDDRSASSADLKRTSLDVEVRRLLPTPTAQDADRWGRYADAIARHAVMVGRPAPEPTEAKTGGRRLSCRFDEWMMGLPAGWITDVPGITHAETIRLCGNGVVPQQAVAALTRAAHRARAGIS